MFKLLKEDTEEEIIKRNEKELEGEFYYMSTRYKSLIPLINEVKAQRGEIQMMSSNVFDNTVKIESIKKQVDKITEYLEKNQKKKK